ncbi:integrase core domain protein [Gregarina niphandrodes]|uniref:Integrase core domain protein n=1 Tax=Gregarina niphandrodes TaxID=110365 RepID=A0A023AWT0_GRENI|nr:integrase core domain protein [Gregarina niphandrodes]EZG43037.1 integrase core domain protein [Gregarina niphandrodes]|eukprot:XP_011133690.1 integrase core domain protein [Gregarina niphandrodes]
MKLQDWQGMLVRRGRAYVPPQWTRRVVQHYHDKGVGTHAGVVRTYRRSQELFWWPRQLQDIREYIAACLVCQRRRGGTERLQGLARAFPANQVFETIHIDYWQTHGEGRPIMTMIDRTSRWVEAAVVPDKTGYSAAAALVRHWITRYGIPSRIICDNDRAFTGTVMRGLLDLLGVTLATITPYHPEGNSPVESFHRHLRKHYQRVRDHSTRGEEEALALTMFLYRTAHHTALGMTPGRWLFGVELVVPEEREIQDQLRNPNMQRLQWLTGAREATIEEAAKVAQERADKRNERRKPSRLAIGDIVLVRDPTVKEKGWGLPHRIVAISEAGHRAQVEDLVSGHKEDRHASVLRKVVAPRDRHQLRQWMKEYRREGVSITEEELQRRLGGTEAAEGTGAPPTNYYELSSDSEAVVVERGTTPEDACSTPASQEGVTGAEQGEEEPRGRGRKRRREFQEGRT